jgi:ankyrin repeat protein
MDTVSALKDFGRAGFALEEVMPEPFRLDVSDNSLALAALSKNSSATQLAHGDLFLTANSLLHGYKLVALIERILGADEGCILEKVFALRSPTVQAFSCRVLESISEWPRGSNDQLLTRLLRCGLDSSILAGPTGGRCLQLAIAHRDSALALLLLRSGVEKNPKLGLDPPFDSTPLELARRTGQKDVHRALLGQDQVEQSPRSKVELALKDACFRRDLGGICSLLDDGMDVDSVRVPSWLLWPDSSWEPRPSWWPDSEPILDWAFFENPQSYDMLLPRSQLAKHFWTVSGILSAAITGRQALDKYLEGKHWQPVDPPYDVLESAMCAALKYGKSQEIRVMLGLKMVTDLLDIDIVLQVAALAARFDIMAKLVQLGADLEALQPVRREMLEHLKVAFMADETDMLEQLLGIGWFSLEEAFTFLIYRVREIHGRRNVGILVGRGLDLNSAIAVDCDGMCTPLLLAVRLAPLDVVEYLVDEGALINSAISDPPYTALGEAVAQGSIDKVNFLLRKGADVAIYDGSMILLESWAGSAKDDTQMEIFHRLLRAGADLNGPTCRSPSWDWNTTLTTAIMNPGFDCEQIRLVLAAGADIHQSGGGSEARTPLQAAAQRGRTDIAKELLKRGACVNAPAAPDSGLTALQAACIGYEPLAELVQLLLEAGADVSAPPAPRHGRTALQAACQGGKHWAEIISLLLKAGADVSAPAAPVFGRTALQALCSSSATSSDLMALLIEKGADINAAPAEEGGITALQGAAIAGNIKVVMLLIDKGAIINAPASARNGRMALDGAAEHGRMDTVQLLLQFGATCMEPGVSGYDSAIRFAKRGGHFAIADLLRSHVGGSLGGDILDFDLFGL